MTLPLAIYARILNDAVGYMITDDEAVRIAHASGHRVGVHASGVRCEDTDADPDHAAEAACEDNGLVYIVLDVA